MKEKAQIIATAGKGGVGKTSLSAAFVRILSETYPEKRILAIDADPAVGLSTALGVSEGTTLDDIRKSIVGSLEQGNSREAAELLSEARYRVLDSLTEKDGFYFIAIGRPESAGCYCKVNAYLKQVIELIAGDFDYVVIDGEAGIEQINRRVMEKVTHLILVSDASRRGLQVIRTIQRVADELVMSDDCSLIINRLPAAVKPEEIETDGEAVIAVIPDCPEQTKNDMLGESVFALEASSPVLTGAAGALKKLGMI